MIRITVVLPLMVALILAGCTEGNVTAPLVGTDFPVAMSVVEGDNTIILKAEVTLQEKDELNWWYLVEGAVDYSIIAPEPGSDALHTLSIKTEATLSPIYVQGSNGFISETSLHAITLVKAPTYIVKEYITTGSKKPLSLFVRFVLDGTLVVDQMWIGETRITKGPATTL